MNRRVAMAVHAHPDDIEFMMAGTLLLLGEAGYELHYMNVASGSGGSLVHPADTLREIRAAESRASAEFLGAAYHPSIRDDLEVIYDVPTVRELGAVIREVSPTILLLPSPQDYMEDHTNVCRLGVTAAFSRGIKNFVTEPRREHIETPICLYHCMPHGLCDPLRIRVDAGAYVDITAVHGKKREALKKHVSQDSWLEASQGGSYVETLDSLSREMGVRSGKFEFAEGWRRHLHYGFGDEHWDPMAEALGDHYLVSKTYESKT